MLALDAVGILQHYANCYDMATREAAAITDDPLRHAYAEGMAAAYKALYNGLKLAIGRSGGTVEVQIKEAGE